MASHSASGGSPPPVSLAYRGASSTAPANLQTLNLSIPSSIQVGDGMILLVSSSSTTLSADPSGWTATASGTITQGSLYSRALTRVAQTGDAGSSVTLSFVAQNKASAVIVAYSGVNGGGANDTFIDVQASATDSSTASHSAPSVTTTKNNDMIISVVTDKASSTSPTTVWTPPSGSTLRASVYNTGAGATSIGVADSGSGVPTGVVPAQTFTSDQAQSNGITWTFALTTGSGIPSGDTQAPSAPSSLVATTQNDTSIALAWTASTDNIGVNHYNIYKNSTKIATSTGTNYTSSGLTAGTAYSYFVTAVDAAGNESAHSNTASATTSNTGTGGPTGVLYGANISGWFHNGETVAQAETRIKSSDPVEGYGPALFAVRQWSSMSSSWSTLVGNNGDGRPLYIDLGSDFNGVNAGNYDATYKTICQTAPTNRPIWLTFCHEPEAQLKNGLTPALWGQAQARLAAIHAQYAPANLKFAPILMGSTYFSDRYTASAPGNYPWTTWFNFDLTNIDAIGADIYPWSTDSVSTAASVEMAPFLAAMQQTGKHGTIGELGIRNEYGWTDAQAASMLNDFISIIDAHSTTIDLCLYFECDNPPGVCCLLPDPYSSQPNFPQAAQVWRGVCNR